MEFTPAYIDTWTRNRDAQADVRATVFITGEDTYGTEPQPVTANIFANVSDTAVLRATLRPNFFQGVQTLAPDLEHAPIELELCDEKPGEEHLAETIATVHTDHIVVSCKLFGFAPDAGSGHPIRLYDPNATDQELAAVDHVSNLLRICAGL